MGSVFGRGRGTGSGNFFSTLTSEAQPGNGPANIWADDPGESTALLAGDRSQPSWATGPPPREPQPRRSLWGEANPLCVGVSTYLGDDDFDSGTDANAISSDGVEPLDWSDIVHMEGDNQRAEH
eukprot:2375816-Pyramimonas_sp.AAC.1